MGSSLVLLTTQAKALDDPLPCHREDLQLWFSDLPGELQLAKAYCQPCPMRRVCLAGAVERHEPHGVWGGEIFARYAGFDNYRRLLDREGVPSPGGVAIVGDEAAIEDQVKGLSDLGVTELWPIVFPVGNDAVGSRRRTRTLLAELACA